MPGSSLAGDGRLIQARSYFTLETITVAITVAQTLRINNTAPAIYYKSSGIKVLRTNAHCMIEQNFESIDRCACNCITVRLHIGRG